MYIVWENIELMIHLVPLSNLTSIEYLNLCMQTKTCCMFDFWTIATLDPNVTSSMNGTMHTKELWYLFAMDQKIEVFKLQRFIQLEGKVMNYRYLANFFPVTFSYRQMDHPYTQKHLHSYKIPYSAKLWRGKTLANLAKRSSFANILPNQIPDSL